MQEYLYLFPIALVEGPVVTIVAGFLCSVGVFTLITTYAVITIADVLSDIFYYLIGYYSEKGIIRKYGHYVGLGSERIEKLRTHFEKHAGKTIIIGKFAYTIGTAVLIASGVAKTPFWKFLFYDLVASLPKSLLLLLIGYYAGESYMRVIYYFNYTGLISLFAFIVILIGYFFIKKKSSGINLT